MQKIKDLPVPKSGKEVATFIGFTEYYHTFIPQYSVITNQLNGIKKAEKFLWNKENHFQRVKESIHSEWNTGFPRLQSKRSVHLNYRMEQGEHRRSVVSVPGRTREIPWMLGKKV